ncbi:hypothetical protein Sru01_39500 [Sphaerisporangium rufum]|uniref:Uncharacterized protein n=1 Tax=Sphaerisporangium rufum TaxID=1381558 RepID=A0A919R4J1_9ACTN|nr:hypothetical protein Sru01_39500 [Sphaerisporangium rufum]
MAKLPVTAPCRAKVAATATRARRTVRASISAKIPTSPDIAGARGGSGARQRLGPAQRARSHMEVDSGTRIRTGCHRNTAETGRDE